MSTRGLFIVRKDNTDSRCVYIDSYAYPERAGKAVVRIIKECEKSNGCNVLSCLLFPTDKDCKGFNSAKIIESIRNGNPFLYTDGYADFIKDSLFCKYAYVINLDEKVLEFYVGFQKEPDIDNRYGVEASKLGYYPCKCVCKLKLNDVVTHDPDWVIGKILERSKEQSSAGGSNAQEKPNELMITFAGGPYLYFKTDKADTKEAFTDFQEACEQAGINIDNMSVKNCILRDAKTYEKLSRNYQPK